MAYRPVRGVRWCSIVMNVDNVASKKFSDLIGWGVLTADSLGKAELAASARGIDVERVLIAEYHIPKHILLQALSNHYHCPFVEYDERMPIPPELLAGLDGERLSIHQWFPIIIDGDTVVIAANDPTDPAVHEEVERFVNAEKYEFWVALGEDIQWFIQDFRLLAQHNGPMEDEARMLQDRPCNGQDRLFFSQMGVAAYRSVGYTYSPLQGAARLFLIRGYGSRVFACVIRALRIFENKEIENDASRRADACGSDCGNHAIS